MSRETLWGTFCKMAGKDGVNSFSLDQAIGESAVTDEIAHIELNAFIDEGLVTVTGDLVALTDEGRQHCRHVEQKLSDMGLDVPQN